MANKLFGNVYYLDATGNLSNINARINCIALWSATSVGNLIICTAADTTNVIAMISSPSNTPSVSTIGFDGGLNVTETMNVKAISGTAWIYLM